MELKDRIVLITGSSDGIGYETALLFAKEGAKVVVTYNSQKPKAEEVFNECKKLNESLLVQLDVTDDNSIKDCVEKVVDEFGAIDILVNNSGVVVWKDLVEQSSEEIESQIDVNVKGLIKMTKKVLPYFQGQNEGIVVNVGSGAGKEGFGEIAPYCATKFAVRGFTKAIAEEFDKNRIKFYCVNPGMTSTKMTGYRGVPPKEVAEVILNAAKENLGKKSGDDIDVWEY
jgi:3-oxoacyl-[acyl-carrier protein] reductase